MIKFMTAWMRISPMLFVGTLLVLSRASETIEQVTIPHFYYYSSAEKAFIVEKADGREKYVLVSFELPVSSSTQGIGGPGWSPSGQWFAWTTYDLEGGNSRQLIANVVKREGGNPFSLINPRPRTTGYDVQMKWSPVEDQLLVRYSYLDMNSAFVSDTFLYDPSTQKTTILRFEGSDSASNRIEWSPDGQFIVFYQPDQTKLVMHLFGMNGRKYERHLKLEGSCGVEAVLPFWAPGTSKVAYEQFHNSVFVIEDIVSGYLVEFDMPDAVLRFVDWSPDGNHALVYTASSCEAKSLQLGLLSLNDQTFTSLLQDATLPESYVMGRLDDWLNRYTLYPISGWSPSGDKAVIFSSDNDLYALALSPYSLQKIPVPLIGKTNFVRWINNSDRCLFERDPIEPQKQAEIFSYDFQTRILDPFLESSETDNISFLALSPHGHFLAYSYLDGYLVDLTTGSTNRIEFMSSSLPEGGRIDEVIWHPSEGWLFILYQAPSMRLVNVVNSEGSIQRELTECAPTYACFGWMPDRVRR
jgi:Tol biopolymer transport system component